jgi:glycosyltransferase involved in cell wall biosynthesis
MDFSEYKTYVLINLQLKLTFPKYIFLLTNETLLMFPESTVFDSSSERPPLLGLFCFVTREVAEPVNGSGRAEASKRAWSALLAWTPESVEHLSKRGTDAGFVSGREGPFWEGLVFKRSISVAVTSFLPTFLSVRNRFSFSTSHPPQRPRSGHSPHIVVGITNPQTCLVLGGRLRTLREAGFRVTLVSSPGELLTRTAAQEGVEAIAIPMRREMAPAADLVSLLRLCWLLYRLKPDMTEFSTPKAGLLGSIAAMLCRVPARVYFLRGLKLETSTGLKRRVLLAAERLASACSHSVLCNSESLRNQAIVLGVAPEAKLRLLGGGSSNGVDVERFSPGRSDLRQRLGLPHDAHVVGFVGRLTRDKGLPELIEAFDAILAAKPNAHLLLVGWFDAAEDALDNDLRSRIRRHPRIHSTGFVADTAPYYRAMDVMVLPTWREGFPNVVLEAAASGIPVVTTLSTGSRDAVVPEVTGLLIPPGYPVAIREAVLQLLGNPERRCRMGEAARAWVLDQYVNGKVLGRTVLYYKALLALNLARNAGISAVSTDSALHPI